MTKKVQLAWRFGLILHLVIFDPFARAQVQIVEIAKVQVAGQLSGEVRDSSGSPLPAATVEEVSPDWENVYQSTKTDREGHFALTPLARKKLYYLVISLSGFNPTRVRVTIEAGSTKQLNIQLRVST